MNKEELVQITEETKNKLVNELDSSVMKEKFDIVSNYMQECIVIKDINNKFCSDLDLNLLIEKLRSHQSKLS